MHWLSFAYPIFRQQKDEVPYHWEGNFGTFSRELSKQNSIIGKTGSGFIPRESLFFSEIQCHERRYTSAETQIIKMILIDNSATEMLPRQAEYRFIMLSST